MTIVNIQEAKSQLSSLIQKAMDGEEVIIADNEEHKVILKAITKKPVRKRELGLYKDRIKIIGSWEEGDEEVMKLMLESKLFPDE